MSTPRMALISDDLTGALDSAVPFALAGWNTVVATSPASLDRALNCGADVVAVSLNSREASKPDASARARHAALALSHVPVLFKKIDSRMKGHVRDEVLALARVRALGRVIVCPAIPELGRFVVDGCVTGHGITTPIPVAFPADGQTDVACPDAGTDADLDRILARSDGALLVGARGLASALARRTGAPATHSQPFSHPSAPISLAIGSRDPVTLVQVMRLREAYPSAHYVPAIDGVLLEVPTFAEVTIIQVTDGGGGLEGAIVSRRLAAGLATGLPTGCKTLLLTGGETASACLEALGIGVLKLLGEVQPGLPISMPLDFPDAPHIVTKSGGFGEPDCLTNLVRVAMDQSRAA